VLGVLFLVVLVAFWPTLIAIPGTWASNSSHGYFVAGLIGWLVWRDRRKILASAGAGLSDLLPVLALLSVAWLLGAVMNIAVVHEGLWVAIVATWALATFGRQARPAILSIALTALLAVPVWSTLTPVLQRGTTIVSGGVTRMFGISAVIGYDTVTISTGTFVVSEACAGLSFFMAGLVLGAFYAHLFLRRWQTQLQVVLLAGAVAIVGNWIRVTTLIFIGEASEMKSGLLIDHGWQGWVIFVLLMIPTYFAGRTLERREAAGHQDSRRTADAAAVTDPRRVRRAVVAASIALVGPILYTGIGMIPRASDPDVGLTTLDLADSWNVAAVPESEVSAWMPDFEGVDRRVSWTLSNGESRVDARRYYFIDQKQGEELIQWGNRIAPDSMLISERLVGPIGQSGRIVREAIVWTGDELRLVWYWYRVAGIDTPLQSKAKFLELVAFLRRSAVAELITLSAVCDSDSCAAAAAALRTAAGDQKPAVARH